MYNPEIIHLLISLAIGIFIGAALMYGAWKMAESERKWAEKQMLDAHARILQLEKDFIENSIANIDEQPTLGCGELKNKNSGV